MARLVMQDFIFSLCMRVCVRVCVYACPTDGWFHFANGGLAQQIPSIYDLS